MPQKLQTTVQTITTYFNPPHSYSHSIVTIIYMENACLRQFFPHSHYTYSSSDSQSLFVKKLPLCDFPSQRGSFTILFYASPASKDTASSAHSSDNWSSRSRSCIFILCLLQAQTAITTISMIAAGISHQQNPHAVCSKIYDILTSLLFFIGSAEFPASLSSLCQTDLPVSSDSDCAQ